MTRRVSICNNGGGDPGEYDSLKMTYSYDRAFSYPSNACFRYREDGPIPQHATILYHEHQITERAI